MVDRGKTFSLISNRNHCQRSSPSRISDTPRAGFEPAQNRVQALLNKVVPTLQNGQTHSNNLSAVADELFVFDHFVRFALKGI